MIEVIFKLDPRIHPGWLREYFYDEDEILYFLETIGPLAAIIR
jgi:hypothetical protein